MNDLDRYLKRATRGLPKAERLRVHEELQGSVLERAAEHQVGGVSEEEALRLALLEFGEPASLAAGMRRVHLWPRLGLFGGLGSAALTLALLTWPPSAAQRVAVTTEGLVARCLPEGLPPGAKTCTTSKRFWVSLNSLKKQLQAQGATLQTTQQTFPAPAAPEAVPEKVTEEFLQVRWTEADSQPGQFEVPVSARRAEAFRRHLNEQAAREGHPPQFRLPSETVFERNGDTYLSGEMVLSGLRATLNLPLRLERPLDGPIVHAGRLRLELGQPGQGIHAGQIVEEGLIYALSRVLGLTGFYGANLLPHPDDVMGKAKGFPQQVRVQGQPGEVYAVLRPVTAGGVNGLGADLVTVDRQGLLHFRSAQSQVRFTGNLRALASSGERKPVVALLRLGPAVTLTLEGLAAAPVEVP